MTGEVPTSFRLAPSDRAEGLLGHAAAEQALLEAYRSGRMHHAWLIEGPQGIGKATLAYRMARFVLAHPDPAMPAVAGAADLSLERDHPLIHQVAARAHPDLLVLERIAEEEGKALKTVIQVKQVRRLVRLLGSTPAAGGWRIVIVDPADDLNVESANALLKSLEEPPSRTLFLLVAHRPGRLPPTIRSRCRRIELRPLPQALVAGALAAAGYDAATVDVASRLADGSLGLALEMASADIAEPLRTLETILASMPRHDPIAAISLAEAAGRRGQEQLYAIMVTLVRDWISTRVKAATARGETVARLAPWAEVWEKVTRVLDETERLKLDRTKTLLAVFRLVSAATARDAARV